MKCPVCGSDCVKSAKDILETLPAIFLPCKDCTARNLDKRAPLPSLEFSEPCRCGKRYIDEAFAQMYVIMVEEGDLKPTDPLLAVGSPLIHPGFVLDRPPFLPKDSVVLLSSNVTRSTAERLVREVPELRGVVRRGDFIPGIASPDLEFAPKVYTLLAGCDVRADVFPLKTGPLVLYKQQSLIHIEFPRPGYPKIRAVEQHIGNPPADLFIDACSGVGTLGIEAACLGVPHVVMNDAWFASAFWSAVNLEVNRDYLRVSRVRIFEKMQDMEKHPVTHEPVKIAETEGEQKIEVYQGDFKELHRVVLPEKKTVSAIDLFNKKDLAMVDAIKRDWAMKFGGDVFVP